MKKGFVKILSILIISVLFILSLTTCNAGKAKVEYKSVYADGDVIYVSEMICDKNMASCLAVSSSYNPDKTYGTGIILNSAGYVLTSTVTIFGSYENNGYDLNSINLEGIITVSEEGLINKVSLSVIDINFPLGIVLLKINAQFIDFVPVELSSKELSYGNYLVSLQYIKKLGMCAVEGTLSKPKINFTINNNVSDCFLIDMHANEGALGAGVFDEYGKLAGIIVGKEKTVKGANSSLNVIFGITYVVPNKTIVNYINNGNFGFKLKI